MKSVLLVFLMLILPKTADAIVKVGSKKFTESVILGDIATLVLKNQMEAVHRKELGGTRVLWNALLAGEIDVYPEYTGTLKQEILSKKDVKNFEEIRHSLAALGVGMTGSLGFNDTYALGIKREKAQQWGIHTISDLAKHLELKLGFSNEFMDREDGWPGLKKRYGLTHKKVSGLDHDLAYAAIDTGKIDVMDLYSTDAEIPQYDLLVLLDDLKYFPEYQAVFVYRLDLERKSPQALASLRQLESKIDEARMSRLNARAKIQKIPELQVASEFLQETLNIQSVVHLETVPMRIFRLTYEHLVMVILSLMGAIFISIPLGILAFQKPRLGQVILALAGMIQTIPSLALLVFLIPFFGIGSPTAMIALFLYSLLPIIRNTYAGLHNIPRSIRESAEVLGLSRAARLRLVELPLASRSIIAGIKISAIINVGTATLGAIIGAGGYGQPILTGIRLADSSLIFQGAVPAACLALGVEALFNFIERKVVSRGLR